MQWLTLKKFAEQTGYTQAAIRQKIQRGDWLLNIHYIKSPDGRIQINIKEYELWVVGMKPALQAAARKV